MKKITLGISALALTVAGAAYADHHMGGHMKGGMKADADGNGIVTRSEAQVHAAEMFAKMDANSDGMINEADRAARMQQRKEKMFAKLDADGNGQISRDEFMSHEREGKGGKHHRMGHRGGGKMMKMADTNNDGAVTQAELTAGALAMFDKADANNDGQVTSEEMRAAHKEMRGKWRERKDG